MTTISNAPIMTKRGLALVSLSKCGHLDCPGGCATCFQVTPREMAFKEAVLDVIRSGKHPSGKRIRERLGMRPSKDLNGEHTRWRREVLNALGWYRPRGRDPTGIRGRWKPPVMCEDTGGSCENSRHDLEPPPGEYEELPLHWVPNGIRCWYLDTCIYEGHVGRWTPITKKWGPWAPEDGCRIIKEFLPEDHAARDQEMNPFELVRVAT